MNFNYFLRQVQKPAKYISSEEITYNINLNGEKVALFYNGSYEESITSVAFQSLFAVFADQTGFSPHRFFMPEDDFLDLLQLEAEPQLWSVDQQLSLADFDHVIVLTETASLVKLAALLAFLNIKKADLLIQNTMLRHPFLDHISERIAYGLEPFKLKLLIQKAASFSELLGILDQEEQPISMDKLKGFGMLTKPIKPIISTRHLLAEYRYVRHAVERRSAEIFQTKPLASANMLLADQKKLDKLVENVPAENELTLFPLGISNKLRQIESLQKTYLELFPTIKKVLAAGWRTIHLFFWLGHPLEEKEDWREFKKEIQAIADFVQIYKKISIQLHFIGYSPTPVSCFLWDEFLSPDAFKTQLATVQTLVEKKKNFRATAEPLSQYINRVFAVRNKADADQKQYELLLKLAKTETFSNLEASFTDQLSQDSTLFSGQAMNRADFNFLCDVNYDALLEQRKSISKLIAEPISDESAELDLRLIKKAHINAHIHLSKTNDMASASLGTEEMSYGRSTKLRASQQEDISRKYRIMFSRLNYMAFYSNVDARNIVLRAFSKENIPVRMSKGFSPAPKIAFSAPTSTGVELHCEYMDVEINSIKNVDLVAALNAHMPSGMTALVAKEVSAKVASLASAINLMEFKLNFEDGYLDSKLIDELTHGKHSVIRETKNSHIALDVGNFIHKINVDNNSLCVQLLTYEQRLLKIEELVDILNTIKPIRFGDIEIEKTRQFIYSHDQYGDPMDA
jgi:radical SAM-linked protein